MKVLSVSDNVIDRIYSLNISDIFSEIEMVIGCGDLPYYYLEYILDMLKAPLFFVHGNHDPEVEENAHGSRCEPWGGVNLHRKVVRYKGWLMAGLEGSVRYSNSRYQYTQLEMWINVLSLVPRMFLNKLVHGRYLDILVTHAPSWGVKDGEDPAHKGFKAFRWLIRYFKPGYHIHGHVHIYDRNDCVETQFYETTVINACDYKRLVLEKKDKR